MVTPSTLNGSSEEVLIEGLPVPHGAGTIPPHVINITDATIYGTWLLLDTQEGITISTLCNLSHINYH